MARITFSSEGQTISISLEETTITIGRDSESYVHLPDKLVSSKHALISWHGKAWMLQDKNSRNGTFINGRKARSLKEILLRHGDEIQIGPYSLLFEDEQELSARSIERLLAGIRIEEDSDSNIEDSVYSTGYGLISVRPEEKLSGILRINQALAGNVDFKTICPRVLDELFEIFPQADGGAVLFLKDERDFTPVAQRRRDPNDIDPVVISRVILNNVLRQNRAILSANTRTDPRTQDSDSVFAQTIHSAMCAPMLGLDGMPFGVISLDSRDRSHRFSNDDLQLLVAVANQASHVCENTRLLTSHMEKLRQDEVMKMSAQVQRALIPAELPQPEGYKFCGSYDAAQTVGGDYFDCFEMPNGMICVSFGDVSGKGFPAALIMSRLSGIVRSTMNFSNDVGLAMSQINRLMCNNMVAGRYVTYILGVIDPQSHVFQYANAGHMAPEIRDPDGRLFNLGTEKSGFPIGIAPDQEYETSSVSLPAGTIVLLRTDGVDDAMSKSGEFYGARRWRDVFGECTSDPEAVAKGLHSAVKAFSAGRTQHDDIAILTFGRLA